MRHLYGHHAHCCTLPHTTAPQHNAVLPHCRTLPYRIAAYCCTTALLHTAALLHSRMLSRTLPHTVVHTTHTSWIKVLHTVHDISHIAHNRTPQSICIKLIFVWMCRRLHEISNNHNNNNYYYNNNDQYINNINIYYYYINKMIIIIIIIILIITIIINLTVSKYTKYFNLSFFAGDH
jgi:hypothetical protein